MEHKLQNFCHAFNSFVCRGCSQGYVFGKVCRGIIRDCPREREVTRSGTHGLEVHIGIKSSIK